MKCKDHKLKTFGCTSIFQNVLWPKQMPPWWQHSARAPGSTQGFISGCWAIYSHSTPRAKAELRLFYITWLQWSQDSQVTEGRFSFSAPLSLRPLPMSSQWTSVHRSSSQLSSQPRSTALGNRICLEPFGKSNLPSRKTRVSKAQSGIQNIQKQLYNFNHIPKKPQCSVQSWPSTDLSLYEYKTTTTCPQKQRAEKHTKKYKRISRKITDRAAYHWQRAIHETEAKVLFRQIPGITTVLGKEL